MNPAVLSMLLTMLIWGIAPVFVRHLSTTIGPADNIIIRYTLVSLAYLPLMFAMNRWRIGREDWPRLAFASFAGVVGYNLGSSFGFAHVGAGLGGLIIGTQPIIIALLSAIVERQAPTRNTLAGLLIAFAGTCTLFWPDLEAGNLGILSGALMIFGAGFSWAFYIIASRPLILKWGTIPVTGWSMILGTLPMWLMLSETTLPHLTGMDGTQAFAMFYMSFLSTFLASMTWNYASARLSASVAGSFLYLVPVIAVIAGAIWLSEEITPAIIAGGAMVLAGVGVAQISPNKRSEPS